MAGLDQGDAGLPGQEKQMVLALSGDQRIGPGFVPLIRLTQL